ncbi:MAG: ATP phosphoribosyltransferase [Elusimicrobia bacterium]|nr:ATP phosphoribosyltransferase [Elusimicrobiota bacterium]
MEKKKLKFALPKGSLQQSTFEIFDKAGIRVFLSSPRSYYPSSDDAELDLMLIRPQEMPRYVRDGVFDAGLCGYDWVQENGVADEVEQVCDLVYAKGGFTPVKWVLAVPESSKINSVKDLNGKRVSTELINYVTRYFREKKVDCEVEFSWGATEVKAGVLVDAIVELTETGSSLRANKLRIVEEVLQSTTRLIANKDSYRDKWKKEKIDNVRLLLKAAVDAEKMVGLKMNIEEAKLDKVNRLLPGITSPTVSRLSKEGWVAVEVVVAEQTVKKILPELNRIGATGIIEYPLNKIVY